VGEKRRLFVLGKLKTAAAKIPIVGPAFKGVYLTCFEGEGKVRPIRTGPLTGMRYYRYRWSTPREDLVDTNWEDVAVGAFTKMIAGKKRVFDVGANWGFYVLLAHKHRDDGCEIVAFEPHPQSAKELGTQIELNNIGNAHVLAAAMSDRIGTLEFLDTGSAIGQKIAGIDNGFPEARKICVPTITLDAAAEQFGIPDLIKLDVEGAENLVLEGGKKVMTKHRPVLIAEIHGEERSGRFYELMKENGYRCQKPLGVEIADGAYHHKMVCMPADVGSAASGSDAVARPEGSGSNSDLKAESPDFPQATAH
jgi:FkbM family methyltransferase